MRRTKLGIKAALPAAMAALLTACGGGGGGSDVASPLPPVPGVACSTVDQRAWLDSYFDEWYFWYRLAPNPNPTREMTVAEFFDASLYTGSDPQFPRDRWSNFDKAEDYNRFFEEGKSLGYGIFLAGIELNKNPALPLLVRYIEPLSDAAAKGVQRGDQVISVNGRTAADIVAADDYTAFSPDEPGRTMTLVLKRGGAERTVTLTSTSYTLQPVTLSRMVTSPQGRRIGYLHVKDMISQASSGLNDAFASFKSQAVQDLVIDLRYNGGGLVSIAQQIGSLVAGSRGDGQPFARLLYNDKRASRENETYRFSNPAQALSLSRIYVLSGPRTCSASELVVNGLRPFANVVSIGDTSCGKPVGFRPVERCDTVFSVVNFEGVNANNEGRYWDGIAPVCRVSDDLSIALGDSSERLLEAARIHADTGVCPAQPQARAQSAGAGGPGRFTGSEPRERQGMVAR